jgi:hypothetical protein
MSTVKQTFHYILSVWEHVYHAGDVGLVHHAAHVQLALALAGLLGQNVALVRAATLERPGACLLEPLSGTFVGL